jgi:hypothetical protein
MNIKTMEATMLASVSRMKKGAFDMKSMLWSCLTI